MKNLPTSQAATFRYWRQAVYRPYHFLMALAGALWYRFPSRELIVIGITGTKGKTTVAEIINVLLETAGHRTALAGTLRFKIADHSIPNQLKMTMPGRFFLQCFLRQAVRDNCRFAIIEMTSEGAAQFRHRFISLDVLVVTGIHPEHIEAHGSYERYVAAKLAIGRQLERSKKARRAIIINGDDAEANKFLNIKAPQKTVYRLGDVDNWKDGKDGIEFSRSGASYHSHLRGAFNLRNILAALLVGEFFDVSTEIAKTALAKLTGVRGRMEMVRFSESQTFDVVVDYAHTPLSLEEVYQVFKDRRKICVLGSTGGGRDVWKRPVFGEIANRHCDRIFLTDEDPYDEDPEKIIEDIASGVADKSKLIKEINRRAAIGRAFEIAKPGDVVIITGKGTDPYIMGPGGEKTVWDDAAVAREELERIEHR